MAQFHTDSLLSTSTVAFTSKGSIDKRMTVTHPNGDTVTTDVYLPVPRPLPVRTNPWAAGKLLISLILIGFNLFLFSQILPVNTAQAAPAIGGGVTEVR